MNSVIVTDVRYRMSLPVIRALGKEKFDITAAERRICKKGAELGFYSKYTSKIAYISDAAENPAQFVADLKKLSESCPQRPAIIPVGITSLLAMCEKHDEIEAFADVALPPVSSIELANDKSRLIPFAGSIGIPVPETTFIKENETANELSLRISYPAVIKLPAGEMLGLSPDERYKIVLTREEFLSEYPRFAALDSNVLVQQYITGEGYGVSAVFGKNHEPVEIFCHHRLREYPASGGPSCFCESADLPELADYAVKLLRALSWEGVAMVEFKGSPETGFYLMEINPRFWGSSALAPNSGCNIPLALFRAAKGETAPVYSSFRPNYKVGHKMRFLLQDLLSFPAYLKRSTGKIRFAAEFLLSLLNPRISDGVLDIRDIRASFKYLKCALKKTDSIVR
ncbi:MAG: ATP-grasp domain-containing protein [Oscillospiraceae bacterium]|nr:ATP-grasp domain-containing protein [Oscillospiraceae bacterium]